MGTGLSGWVDDVAPAEWIAPRLRPFNQDTGSVIPEGFDAYCRVFHPIGADGRWSDLARRNDRVAHPQMQLHAIATPRGERVPAMPSLQRPATSWGSLPSAPCGALVDLLRSRTATADRCWFAVWEGWGGLDAGGVTVRVRLPGRAYLLRSGAIDAALDPVPMTVGPDADQSPSFWWPNDRAWLVATDIDYAWSYVGGTSEAVDAVLRDDRVEALSVTLDDLPFADADVINAELDD